MNRSLRGVGFEPDLVLNTSLRQFEQAVDRFVSRIQPGDVALFYYAGHGTRHGSPRIARYQAYPCGSDEIFADHSEREPSAQHARLESAARTGRDRDRRALPERSRSRSGPLG